MNRFQHLDGSESVQAVAIRTGRVGVALDTLDHIEEVVGRATVCWKIPAGGTYSIPDVDVELSSQYLSSCLRK